MSHDYSENKLVQDSAGNLLQNELGWEVVFAYNQETLGENGTLGRKSYREIILWRYFKKALKSVFFFFENASKIFFLFSFNSLITL